MSSSSQQNIVERVKRGRAVLCEFDPPKDLSIKKYLEGAKQLEKAGLDAITLADNSLATSRMCNMAVGTLIKRYLKTEPLVHLTCRDRNLLGLQSRLMGLHALGIRQILAVTGDPVRMGDLPKSTAVCDINSMELIRHIKQMNEGISFSGRELSEKTYFTVGTSFNPNVRQLDSAMKRLEKKVSMGADFVMTQPVYDVEAIDRVAEAVQDLSVPVFIGIMPIVSYRNALFLHRAVPGIKIAEKVLQLFEQVSTKEDGLRLGMEICKELLDVALGKFSGIYLITPFQEWKISVELLYHIRRKDTLKLTVANG